MRKAFIFILHLTLFSTILFGQELTVGVYQNPPLLYLNDNQEPEGIFYDLLSHIAEEEGWNLNFEYGSFNEVLERLQNSDIDIMPDLARANFRDSLVLFNHISVIPTWGQVFSKDQSLQTLAGLQGKKIGHLKNDIFIEQPVHGLRSLLEQYNISAELVSFEDYNGIYNYINDDQVDAIAISRIVGLVRFRNQTFLDFKKIHPTPIIFAPVDLHYALPLGDPRYIEFANIIDRYVVELKKDESSTYYKLIQEHMFPGSDYSYPEWLVLIFLPIGVIFILQYSFNSVLRNSVNKKTRQLKTANERIQENEARIRLAMETTQEGVFEWNIIPDEFTADELIMDQFGLGPVGYTQDVSNFRKLVHLDHQNIVRSSFEKFIEEKKEGLHRAEIRLQDRNGKYIWVAISGKVIEWDGERPIRYLGIIANIQDRKEAERARELLLASLKERNKELSCLYEVSQLITDPSRSIPEVLDLAVNLLPESWQYPVFTCARITYSGKTYESEGFKKSEWFQATDIFMDEDIVGTIEIYYLKEMPQADEGPFMKEERELLNSLSSILSAMIDRTIVDNKIEQKEIEERERISKELHDGVQQTLTVASMNLDYLNNRLLNETEDKGLKEKLDTGIENVTKAIKEIRDIAHELDIEYVLAVEKLVKDLEKVTDTRFSFFQNLGEGRLETNLERNLYRITQEVINNILKHSKAPNATIQLMKHDDFIILTIEDDGVGFDLNSKNYGFGLNGIKNRSRSIHAKLMIDSALGKGTSITVEVQMSPITKKL